LDDFSLANHSWFAKFAKLSSCQAFLLYRIKYVDPYCLSHVAQNSGDENVSGRISELVFLNDEENFTKCIFYSGKFGELILLWKSPTRSEGQ